MKTNQATFAQSKMSNEVKDGVIMLILAVVVCVPVGYMVVQQLLK